MHIFLDGFFLGLAYAMPIGSQNVFVIGSALSQKLPQSYVTAAVVSIVDMILGLACLLGVGKLLIQYNVIRMACFFIGAFFLFYLATQLILTKEMNFEITGKSLNFKKIVQNCVLLTWLNPQAIIDGSLLFGTYRAALSSNELLTFSCGIILASPLWFFSLTTMVGYFGQKMSKKAIRNINIVCAIMLYLLAINLLFLFVNEYMK